MNGARLYHASDDPDIARFAPRPPPTPQVGPGHDCVWAVDFAHLANYCAPRDCPRAIVRRGAHTADADAGRFLGAAHCVVTIQADWLDRFRAADLTLYAFAPDRHWRLHDANQGAYVTAETVEPIDRHRIRPVEALAALGAELRIVDDLWPVIDAIRASTLRFSIIRARNLPPRG